jgi:tRNA A-37 threonylcarbamoyl transferase component Bud32/flagellar motility protein MotE (MotC chaperone)
VTSPGDELNRRYRLDERLGGGGMGSVWKAYDMVLERTVAVKELISGHHDAEDIATRLERVRREALALAKVEHPAIATIHDLMYVRSDNDPWIVMGYVHGSPLDKIINGASPLPQRKIASIGLTVLEGLMACHRCHVYHRDVKPANIVVGEDGLVRLVDFGIARIVGKAPLTALNNVPGTPQFLAPELLNNEPADPATDLWALAVTLYYALEGQAPFNANSLAAMIAAIQRREPPEPRSGGPLAALVMRMLMKDRAARPDTATVAAVLKSIESGAAPASQPYLIRASQPRGVPRQASPRQPGNLQPVRPPQRLTPFSGLPARAAARRIASLSAEQAAAELIALDLREVAGDIILCADPVAGAVLSAIAIAAGQPASARKILEMVTQEQAGRLLDHMSSAAAAAALALPTAAVAVLRMAKADTLTVVGVLTEMPPLRAAALVQAMDDDVRAVEVLRRMPDPANAASILLQVFPAARRRSLLNRLSAPLRALVSKHMERMSGSNTSAEA